MELNNLLFFFFLHHIQHTVSSYKAALPLSTDTSRVLSINKNTETIWSFCHNANISQVCICIMPCLVYVLQRCRTSEILILTLTVTMQFFYNINIQTYFILQRKRVYIQQAHACSQSVSFEKTRRFGWRSHQHLSLILVCDVNRAGRLHPRLSIYLHW